MNDEHKKNILELADIIRAQPTVDEAKYLETPQSTRAGFRMVSEFHSCGTPACIGGWNSWVAEGKPERVADRSYSSMIERATDRLGIDQDTANALFYMYGTGYDFSAVEAADAARVLVLLAETGEVKWNEVLDAKDWDE